MDTTHATGNLNHEPFVDRRSLLEIHNQFLTAIESLPGHRAQVLEALHVAEDAHTGQLRKPHVDGVPRRDPYVIHPIRVALILMEEAGQYDPSALAGALLHDVVEDSQGRYTLQDMRDRFGHEVADLVACVTKPVSNHELTAIQLATYYQGIQHAPSAVREVKLADRLDNLREATRVQDTAFQRRYLAETRQEYLPIARQTSQFFHHQLTLVCDYLEMLVQAH